MVAPQKTRRIVCTIVRVSENPGDRLSVDRLAAGREEIRNAVRPSRLVPWADPYIAGLVRKLQSEVRFDRAQAQRAEWSTKSTSPRNDMEPPSPACDPDWQWEEEPRWSWEDQAGEE